MRNTTHGAYSRTSPNFTFHSDNVMCFRMPHLAMSILRIASFLLFCKFYLGPTLMDERKRQGGILKKKLL